MENHDHDKKCNCKCCPGPMGHMGPQGNPGMQGPMGPQGIKGVDGKNGLDGIQGAMGPAGPTGPQGFQGIKGQDGLNGQDGLQGIMGPQGVPGEQGLQGPKGDCIECPCDCDDEDQEFCQIYSIMNQNIISSPGINLAGGPVLFEKLVFSTSNIDVSNAGITGEIKINKKGWYVVQKEVCGALNPVSAPLISWGLSLFKNGLLVPGTTFTDMTLSPDQQANETSAIFLIHFDKGDVLTLNNMCIQNLLLNAFAGGSFGINAQSNSASILIRSVEFN